MHAIVFESIQRKLDVGICAVEVVGDNGGKLGACAVLGIDAVRDLGEAVGNNDRS